MHQWNTRLSRHFGYVLFDERGEPFYIGIGSRTSRPTDHIRNAKKGLRGRRYSKIRRMLRDSFDIPIVVFREGMTLAEAKEMEVALVRVIKRWPDGPLTNINAGGNSPHDVHYRAGKTVSPETRAKIRLSLTGRVLGPYSPERIERAAAPQRGVKRRPLTADHRAKVGEASARTWLDPTVREKRLGMKGKRHSPETISRMKASAKARVTAEIVERMRAIGSQNAGSSHTAATKAKMSESQRKRWKERKEVQSDG